MSFSAYAKPSSSQRLLGKAMSLGSVMIDIQGTQLTQDDKERLLDPLVAGVILFSRNYESVEQLKSLTTEIHALRHPRLLIGVDHEGGRVQRFREGFTRLPPMRALGKYFAEHPEKAQSDAQKVGWLLASELLACGVDFSFTPVLDIDYGGSKVIGDRAFSSEKSTISKLATHLMQGMHQAGMACVGKHFPGHGFIEADTHLEIAVDERSFSEIQQKDLQPFLGLIAEGLEAVMPAHVIYPQVDNKPAGFSNFWLQEVLRKKCHFEGAIISDDMSMQAAKSFGDIVAGVETALNAGCDLVLVCNDPIAADTVIAQVKWQGSALNHARLIRLQAHGKFTMEKLHLDPVWQSAVQAVNRVFNYQEVQEALL